MYKFIMHLVDLYAPYAFFKGWYMIQILYVYTILWVSQLESSVSKALIYISLTLFQLINYKFYYSQMPFRFNIMYLYRASTQLYVL